MISKILCANDGSPNAFKAFEYAAELALKCGADLHVILVEEVQPLSGTIEDIAVKKEREDRLLHRHEKHINEIAAAKGVSVRMHAFSGHPVHTIVTFAKDENSDLLVIGATGHHASVYEFLLGGRADRIVHMAPCPVLVVR